MSILPQVVLNMGCYGIYFYTICTGPCVNCPEFIQMLIQRDRCHQAPATLLHVFWSCPSLRSYWTSIFDTICDVLRTPIDLSLLISLFGVLPETVYLPKFLFNVVILLNWKKKYNLLPTPIGFGTFYIFLN